VPGAAVAVGMGDQLAEAATGVINLDTGVEATADSLFQIGSVSRVAMHWPAGGPVVACRCCPGGIGRFADAAAYRCRPLLMAR
jgi:hypothetical protein